VGDKSVFACKKRRRYSQTLQEDQMPRVYDKAADAD